MKKNSIENSIPIIAIVGRPNVGKSTIFNRLAGRWSSIVEDQPGITRDRLFAECEIAGHPILLMDTGGLQFEAKTRLERKMSEQAYQGILEADLIVFVCDGRDGLTNMDRQWIEKIRKVDKSKIFLVNKLDDPSLDVQLNEFHALGLKPLIGISAENQRNFSEFYEEVVKIIGGGRQKTGVAKTPDSADFSVAITGRPNVGKSTLLNALLNEERCIVDDIPGTTRDPVDSYVTFDNKQYRFVDTAGIRRRAQTTARVDKFSIVQSLKVIDQANLVLLLIDGSEGPTDQDAHVAGHAFEKGKAIIIIVNKWDEGQKKFKREDIQHQMELKMNYLNYCPVLYLSAKTGKNLSKIFTAIESVREQFEKEIKTSELNKVFAYLIEHHPLPVYAGKQIKMFYATQVSHKPPTFAVFCNYPKNVHFSYQRYLINSLREAFGLKYVPVRVVFKGR